LYPGEQHPHPDPFQSGIPKPELAAPLRRTVERQEQQFADLVDRVVPIDLTRVEDGFDAPAFGGERLKSAILELLPAAYRQTFLSLDEAMRSLRSLNERRAMPYIIGYSTMAATAATVPAPWVDIPVVLAFQSHLVYRLRDIYGKDIDAPVVRRFLAAVSGRVVTRLVLRESLKLIPLAGIAANAALSFAYTYGLGRACCWYFGEIRDGNAPTASEVQHVWREQLAVAARRWSSGGSESANFANSNASEPAVGVDGEETGP
jgi:uncharacterized protein (DUF697 family)